MATNRSVAEKLIAQASHYTEEPEMIFKPDVAATIPETIREMVMQVASMGSQADRKLLQKDFTLAVTTAVGFDTVDLTASLTTDPDRMLLWLPFTSVSHSLSQSGELLYTPDKAQLTTQRLDEGFDYYTVEGQTMYINADPELTGNVIIRSFYVPRITVLDDKFIPMLIEQLLTKMINTRKAKK